MSTTLSELKALSQWVGYTAKKIPMCPHTGGAAASNNPDTWGTAAEAWRAKQRYGWAGIGFVFTIGAGVVGIDLDDCFTGEGDARRLTDTARQVVQMANSYTELSPSGNGLHILACGQIPHSIKTAGFEMYGELRYFTVTGKVYGEARDIEDRPDELLALYAAFCNEPEAPTSSGAEYGGANDRYTQAALMRAMQTVSLSANGTRNHTLFAETASLIELVNAGALAGADVERVMTAAALAAGLEIGETTKTIASAFKSVTKARSVPPPRPRYRPVEDAV